MRRTLALLLLTSAAFAQSYFIGGSSAVTIHRAATMANGAGTVTLYVNTLTYAAGVATVTAGYGGLSLSPGNTVVVAGTGTCQDGSQTVATVVSASPASYTYNTACTATWTENYESIPALAKLPSGTLVAVYDHHGNDTNEDVSEGDLAYRTSPDGGATWSAPLIAVANVGNVLCAPSATCNPVNPTCGPTLNGKIVCLYSLYQVTPAAAFKGVYSVIFDGASWTAPTQVTAVDSGVVATDLTTAQGQIATMPSGCIGVPIALVNFTTYLYVSCDNGGTWGSGTGYFRKLADSGGTALNFAANETACGWISGTTRYLCFSRGCNASCAPPNGTLYVATSANGTVWTLYTSNFSFVDYPSVTLRNHISPVLLPSVAGNWTLCFGERVVNGNYRAAIKCITFDPAAAYANPTGFGRTQAAWLATSSFPAVGYPALAMTGDTSVALMWMSQIYPASTVHLHSMTATFAPPSLALTGFTLNGFTSGN